MLSLALVLLNQVMMIAVYVTAFLTALKTYVEFKHVQSTITINLCPTQSY